MTDPNVTHDGRSADHETAVRVSNELLRELCAGELGPGEVSARATDLVAHPELIPDASDPSADKVQTSAPGHPD